MIIPSNHLINGSESACGNGSVSYTTIESSGTNPFNNTLGPLQTFDLLWNSFMSCEEMNKGLYIKTMWFIGIPM